MPDKKKVNKVEEPTAEYEQKHTYADYLQAGAGVVYETIRGKIMTRMSPGAGSTHQLVHTVLFGELYQLLKNQRCKLFSSPYDVILPVKNETKGTATTIVQPDLCVVCNPDLIEERGCFGAPDLIVEIVSPSKGAVKRDVQHKYSIYEEAGVKEYWIVFPPYKLIEIYVLENGNYNQVGRFAESDILQSPTLPLIQIDLEVIFKN